MPGTSITPAPTRFGERWLLQPEGLASIDGVICFGGGDWWYHNRGHFDVQMMRELATLGPVLYVNSIGMRVPRASEGRMFVARVRRKLASLRRGHVLQGDGLSVLSPVSVPGRAGMAMTRTLLARAVRAAARERGIERPLVWVACPPAAEVVDDLDPALVVYQCTDRFVEYPDVDRERIGHYDEWLKARADLTLFCSRQLHEEDSAECHASLFVDHGVDAYRFMASSEEPAPADLTALGGPRVGFVGGIDAHTMDPALLVDVTRRLHDVQFALVGACSFDGGWGELPNVHLLGQRPYEEVPGYMSGCDVLIMPWNRSSWIESCNPVKLKEYLATGRPVVSVDFPEVRRYAGLVRIANDADTFTTAIKDAIANPGNAAARQASVLGCTWRAQAKSVLDALAGETPAPAAIDHAPVASQHDRASGTEAKLAVRSLPPLVGIGVTTCVMLAGGLRPSDIARQTNRHVLDLWLYPDRTLLDAWIARIEDIEHVIEALISLRVVCGTAMPAPWPRPALEGRVAFEQDPRPLRGPAGVLRDVCHDLEPDEQVLVVEAARFPCVDLTPLVRAHRERDADVTFAINPDDSPAGAYVIRAGLLDTVPETGFCDVKEQWLPRLASAGRHLAVHRLVPRGLLPLRTREHLLEAVSASVISPSACVDPGATVFDSILMPRAVVHEDAVVVRSVICPGAVVGAGERVVDSVVPGLRGGHEELSACA